MTKHKYRSSNTSLIKDLFIWLVIPTAFIALFALTGLDNIIAKAVYTPESKYGWYMRQYGNIPAFIVCGISLLFLLFPPWRRKKPFLRKTAAIYVLTLIFGVGLLNQVIVQDFADRPRPRETVTLGGAHDYHTPFTPKAEIKGKSFPSGHAAMGFLIIAPFFMWRRKNPALAKTFLLIGLAYGIALGSARMIVGAHYLSDVIGAMSITLLPTLFFTRLIPEKRDVSTWLSVGLIVVAAASIVWFNKFTIQLTQTLVPTDTLVIDLPCKNIQVENGTSVFVNITLKGYGAPKSNILLKTYKNKIFLDKYKGIYRDLTCDATITVPPATRVVTEESLNISYN